METLNTLLEKLNIRSEEQLRAYIDANYGSNNSCDFKIIKRCDLNIDSENRIYDREVKYTKTIFDLDDLQISNSRNIYLQDCIFTGQLNIGNKENFPVEIFIDHTAISRGVSIGGVISNCIELNEICTAELSVTNNEKIDRFRISSSSIGSFLIYNSYINNLKVYFNKFMTILVSCSEFGKVHFPHGQVDISVQKVINRGKWLNSLKSKFNYLKNNNSFNINKISQEEQRSQINETFIFLLKHSDCHINVQERSDLIYAEGLSSIKSKFLAFMYWLCGGLIKPLRLIILIAFTIVIFAIVYYYGPYITSTQSFSFNVSERGQSGPRGLSLGESLYFSGITFTTIGYGDISPIGIPRILAVCEGLCGIFLSSAFVVSLARRYFHRDTV